MGVSRCSVGNSMGSLGTFAVIAYFIADEERTNARDLLAKNYWSNALDAKEKNRWLRM